MPHSCRRVLFQALPLALAELVEEPADVFRIVLLAYRGPFCAAYRADALALAVALAAVLALALVLALAFALTLAG